MGKAKNLKERVSSYFTNKNISKKTKLLIANIKSIKTIETYSEVNSLVLEANLIKKHQPMFNTKLTDDKSYLYVKITINDKYPKVLVSRRIDDEKSLYFGPFPNAKSIRLVLKTIRKIFPFQSVKNHPKKICLYNHLNLCPCPEVLLPKDYKKKNIKFIIRFLNGENKKILNDLINERNKFSKNEEFEKANEVQKKINSINLITDPRNRIFDFESNLNLSFDLKKIELEELKKILNKYNYNLKKLSRIECFDVSNISGTNTVGSMVVFKNGLEDKKNYRKFKIKNLNKKQNDLLSINEMLDRRFNHFDWKFPNLIIIDGGKGQVGTVKKILKLKKLKIPVIGLAKNEEKIITEGFKEIVLKYDSPALLFLKRVRDEAHRFAITYHRKLRLKSFFK